MTSRDYGDISKQKNRLRLVSGLVFFLVLVVITRLFYLQLIKHNYYVKIAAGQHWAKDTIPASRGKIYVKDELAGGLYPIADNEKKQLVWAAPEEIGDKPGAARILSPLVGAEESKLKELLENNHTYVVLARGLDFEQGKRVEEKKLKGIGLSDEDVRYYPEGSLASQTIGYVDTEGEGKYGLEQYFNDELSGVPGLFRAEIDPSGNKIAFGKNVQVEPKHGTSIVLTINRDVQLQAEKIIKSAVEKFSAEGGSLLVMDPQTGEILAIANYPTYDPNKYKDVKDYKLFGNAAVSDEYEPGSIFKAVTMAMGLETKKVEPDSKYEDTGSITLSGFKIMNSDRKTNGWQTMTQVLEKSLNTGTVYVLDQIGRGSFYQFLDKFGFGKITGIEQPNEGTGRVSSQNQEGVTEHTIATMSFGQSISTTPLQMLNSFAVIANGGKLLKPRLVAEKLFENGKKEKTKTEVVEEIMSSDAAAKERQMLVSVVENGHGGQAKVKGYKIAGKTGTAQVPKKNGTGYDATKNIGSFIGFGPADSPRFVVMAKVDSPKGIPWAETSAAPAVGQMLDFLFKYYQIPPTEK